MNLVFFKKIFNNKVILIILVIFLLLIGTGIRAKFMLNPDAAFKYDMILFKEWSRNAHFFNFGYIYERRVNENIMLPNYMPGYLYFLKFSGFIYQKFFSPNFDINRVELNFLLKANAVLFDILASILIFFVLKKGFGYWAGFLGMFLYFFNPGILILSSYWGQVDSVHSFFILLSFILVAKNKFTYSWLSITLAILIKLQAIIFLPLIFILNIISILQKKSNLVNFLVNILSSIALSVVVTLPFLIKGTFINFIKVVFGSVGFYKYASLNAFNIWWPLTNGDYMSVSDTEKIFNLIPYFYIGLLLFVMAYAFAIYALVKRNDRTMIYLIASFIALSFFMLPTQIHERYLFPVFALLVMIIWKNRRLFLTYFILSFVFFANIISVLLRDLLPEGRMISNEVIKAKWLHFILQNIGSFVNILLFIYLIYFIIKYIGKKQAEKLNFIKKNENNIYPSHI